VNLVVAERAGRVQVKRLRVCVLAFHVLSIRQKKPVRNLVSLQTLSVHLKAFQHRPPQIHKNFTLEQVIRNAHITVKKQRLTSLLREIRVEAGLTQAAVAKKIGQTQSYVSKYEQGEQRLDLLELEAVCKAVGISLTEFVRRFVEG
jgi:DNA-binding XRE family transcriptional regulator